MGRYYFTDDEIEVERSSNFPKTAQLFIKWQNLKSNCGDLTPESLILIVIPYGNVKKLQKNLTPHFTDKKASRESSVHTDTTELRFTRSQVSRRLVLNAFHHPKSSSPILGSTKESLLLNTFNSGKKQSPCMCLRDHSSWLWVFPPN